LTKNNQNNDKATDISLVKSKIILQPCALHTVRSNVQQIECVPIKSGSQCMLHSSEIVSYDDYFNTQHFKKPNTNHYQ